ncbi:HPr family phosphocarrier protein [Candidatus Riesia pediculischaeffi]|uniref:Phosphocarrier protein HPr n=2 Tax=Candidatus Riesia pediculischaeffi TaxID=428411 RepID=A0A1V0HJX2_9ENTR|nr:HPr family phosphocarrier protein [Candidatus Riesia pediculischaeffi]ARC53128.1 PTS sugar transporter [Candidatus Riesia pediculischaeffi]KIE64254.1 Phosphotransferase system, phosphocarrier protein HPr [Candidatus Riesia pediculischaeffi PTSU]
MFQKEVIVNIKNGFHIRPASQFVKKAKDFSSDITIIFKKKMVNAKSLFRLQTLGISSGDIITISAEGKDERNAVEVLTRLIDQLK